LALVQTNHLFFLDIPGPPNGPIRFSDVTADSITIAWEAPSDDGGGDISNYAVDYREFGRATWSTVTTCTTRTFIKVRKKFKNSTDALDVR